MATERVYTIKFPTPSVMYAGIRPLCWSVWGTWMILRTYVVFPWEDPFHFHTAGQSSISKGKESFKIQNLVPFLRCLSIQQVKSPVRDDREQLNLIVWVEPANQSCIIKLQMQPLHHFLSTSYGNFTKHILHNYCTWVVCIYIGQVVLKHKITHHIILY